MCLGPARPGLLLVAVLVAAGPLPADEPTAGKADLAPPTVKELAEQRMVFMKAALSRFTIRVGGRKEEARACDPCLRWTDPVSNSADGVVAVYAHGGGRPAALAQFFLNSRKRWIAEFTVMLRPLSGLMPFAQAMAERVAAAGLQTTAP